MTKPNIINVIEYCKMVAQARPVPHECFRAFDSKTQVRTLGMVSRYFNDSLNLATDAR